MSSRPLLNLRSSIGRSPCALKRRSAATVHVPLQMKFPSPPVPRGVASPKAETNATLHGPPESRSYSDEPARLSYDKYLIDTNKFNITTGSSYDMASPTVLPPRLLWRTTGSHVSLTPRIFQSAVRRPTSYPRPVSEVRTVLLARYTSATRTPGFSLISRTWRCPGVEEFEAKSVEVGEFGSKAHEDECHEVKGEEGRVGVEVGVVSREQEPAAGAVSLQAGRTMSGHARLTKQSEASLTTSSQECIVRPNRFVPTESGGRTRHCCLRGRMARPSHSGTQGRSPAPHEKGE